MLTTGLLLKKLPSCSCCPMLSTWSNLRSNKCYFCMMCVVMVLHAGGEVHAWQCRSAKGQLHSSPGRCLVRCNAVAAISCIPSTLAADYLQLLMHILHPCTRTIAAAAFSLLRRHHRLPLLLHIMHSCCLVRTTWCYLL
jgi:hypothetical protein